MKIYHTIEYTHEPEQIWLSIRHTPETGEVVIYGAYFDLQQALANSFRESSRETDKTVFNLSTYGAIPVTLNHPRGEGGAAYYE